MKNLRMQIVEKIWCVLSNFIFKSTQIDLKSRKLIICKFATHGVIGSKLKNFLDLSQHCNRLAICWLAMISIWNSLARNCQVFVQMYKVTCQLKLDSPNFNMKINQSSIAKQVHILFARLVLNAMKKQYANHSSIHSYSTYITQLPHIPNKTYSLHKAIIIRLQNQFQRVQITRSNFREKL